MNLLQKQQAFAAILPKLLLWLTERGYLYTLGEVWRPKEMAEIYKAKGLGITNSLHWIRLAIDLNLWKDGKLLTETEEYREAGEYWESLSTPELKLSWGGRFGDGNHFSAEHNGVR